MERRLDRLARVPTGQAALPRCRGGVRNGRTVGSLGLACHGRCPAPDGFRGPVVRLWGDRVSPGIPAGTRVQMKGTGHRRQGIVMPYEPEYSHGSFPVRFDDGIWQVLNASYVVVVAPSEGSDQ